MQLGKQLLASDADLISIQSIGRGSYGNPPEHRVSRSERQPPPRDMGCGAQLGLLFFLEYLPNMDGYAIDLPLSRLCAGLVALKRHTACAHNRSSTSHG